ncbi:conserved hypothetical protein [Thermosulfidibacter takaii ABI70S6]|uniref:DUF3783 domain-containing protein n=1 Tax=Thermosulfidibacter takaii (strain DSM 17441 / JCM 13301 / NBRC 103674 / ABI70S6) TaxID=1298851 RepID=A0A0S3QTA8_THET7|nr:DUF3783 domain-containing protein [Thermosulfidibacter takaii]BAT71559.1 conserved hypothetical protein [Thermosulfidibacter takaii ABI70S6]
MEEKIVVLHGFNKEELGETIKLLKEKFPNSELIFAVTTPHNLTWKLQDLIDELKKEHAYFKKAQQEKKGD